MHWNTRIGKDREITISLKFKYLLVATFYQVQLSSSSMHIGGGAIFTAVELHPSQSVHVHKYGATPGELPHSLLRYKVCEISSHLQYSGSSICCEAIRGSCWSVASGVVCTSVCTRTASFPETRHSRLRLGAITTTTAGR